ncbi:IS66 family transposase, partial [Thiolapillus sp.]|uniref:IS66 family transposase n=1 Tax=Thiolapillus sp. TaxID=2017437 RepID=UPI003AF9C8FC
GYAGYNRVCRENGLTRIGCWDHARRKFVEASQAAPAKKKGKRVFGLVIDFGTSQSPKSTRPLTTHWCPSRPGHQALRNNFASSLLLRTWLPMTGRRVRRPTLFSLWRKARRENSAASRLLGSTSLRFALHGWQRTKVSKADVAIGKIRKLYAIEKRIEALPPEEKTRQRQQLA